ncbi:MAG: hypothetical protein J0L97_05120 [Alphaproteobacteria bacterium]|nr:hypothetical protein [Alphaproteobacteria bacterium]
MFRLMGFAWLVVLVVSAYGLYLLKNKVEVMRMELADTRGQIVSEKERQRVLSAEYAYLARPERLEEIARRHLSLQVMAPSQILASVGDIPYPQPKEAPVPAPSQGMENNPGEVPMVSIQGASPVSWNGER